MTVPTTTPERVLHLRLICEAPPSRPGIEFGLQERSGVIRPGAPEADGALRFEGEVRVVVVAGGAVRLRGPIVHGPPAAPFLYLSCRAAGAPGPWLFRLKVPLIGIDPGADVVEARIRATGGGTVPLIGDGWIAVQG